MQLNIGPRVKLVFNDNCLGATRLEKDLVMVDTSNAMMVGSWDYERGKKMIVVQVKANRE